MEILVLRQFLVEPVLRKVVLLQGYLGRHVYVGYVGRPLAAGSLALSYRKMRLFPFR